MINDIQIIDVKKYDDNRGFFSEIYRANWFSKYSNDKIQLNHSFSKRGVLRGLHYHYHQYDYWYVVDGFLTVCLLDMRKDSSTFKQHQFVDITNNIRYIKDSPIIGNIGTGLFIPPGVAHGFYAVKDTHLIYVVNNYYDSSDDLAVNWKSVKWNVVPKISERDFNAPMLNDIDESTLVF